MSEAAPEVQAATPADARPATETITLHAGGAIPGLPGVHGAGTYHVNWLERTIKRLEDHLAEEVAKAKALLTGASDVPASEPAPVAETEPVAEPEPEAPPAPAEDEASAPEEA